VLFGVVLFYSFKNNSYQRNVDVRVGAELLGNYSENERLGPVEVITTHGHLEVGEPLQIYDVVLVHCVLPNLWVGVRVEGVVLAGGGTSAQNEGQKKSREKRSPSFNLHLI